MHGHNRNDNHQIREPERVLSKGHNSCKFASAPTACKTKEEEMTINTSPFWSCYLPTTQNTLSNKVKICALYEVL